MNMQQPISNPETITVKKNADGISCDGGQGAMGHPIVYYSFNDKETITCGYCDREFTKK